MLTPSFTEPFYEGVEISSSEVPWPQMVALGGRSFLLDLKQYERSTIQALREARDSGAEPGESTLNPAGIWKRNGADWTHGAGQRYWDGENADRQRFWSSKGINVWEPRELTLLNGTGVARASTDANQQLLAAGEYLYFAHGNIVEWANSLAGPWQVALSSGSPIQSMTTDGSNVYIATGASIYRTAAGTTSTTVVASYAADEIEYVNGWLLACNGNELVEIQSGGSTNLLKTHVNPNFQWSAIASSPSFIYVAGYAGNRSEIYRIGVDEGDGSLLVPVFAGSLADGEQLAMMSYYGGAMVIGTNKGVRLAIVGDDGGLSAGKRIDTDSPVRCVAVFDRFAWYGFTNLDATSTGLGRLDLSVFVDTLTPAWATDLMYDGQGEVTGLAVFDDAPVFAVSGVGLIRQTPTLEPEGVLVTGWMNFGIYERKVLSGIDMRYSPLAGEIEVKIEDENGAITSLGVLDQEGTIGPSAPVTGRNLDGEMFRLHLYLRGDALLANGPTLLRFSVRAMPAPLSAEEIILPLILSWTTNDEIPGGKDRWRDPLDDFLFLKNLEASREVVLLQEGKQTLRGTVRAVAIKSPTDYDFDRGFYESVCMVRFVTDASVGA